MRQSTQPLGKSAADRPLQGTIEGKRRRGRPRKSWIDQANPSQRLEPWPQAEEADLRRCRVWITVSTSHIHMQQVD